MDKSSLLCLFLLALIVTGVAAKDPFRRLVDHEAKQRQMAGLSESEYHLLPFRLSGQKQHFIQVPQTDQLVYAEVVVHWIGANSSLRFPTFDLKQKVRIIIEEETLNSAPTKAILTREFLTQTGFKVNMTAGRRYRWRIESDGKQQKMIQIAVASQPLTQLTPTFTNSTSSHYNQVVFLKQMSATLARVKEARARREQKQEEGDVESMWAWMSGVEMFSLICVVLVQLTLFEKFLLPTSVV